MPQLRSLYILQIQDHISGAFAPKDMALQLVDIITLRPEVQLCYVGIKNKCFEILECSPNQGGSDQFGSNGSAHQGGAISVIDLDEDNENGSNNNSDTDDTEDDDGDAVTNASGPTDDELDFTEVSDVESDADDFEEPHHSQSGPRLRLREILFYDDKVAIFKARHGRI